MNRVRFHPKAAAEVNESALYLDRESSGLGDEFLDALETAVCMLIRFPNTWPCVRNDIRRFIMPRFQYNIFYRLRPGNAIEIIAVMHPKRRPFNFLNRL